MKRKRSRAITLIAMGTSLLALTACDDPVDVAVFEDTIQCAQAVGLTSEECEAKYEKATVAHQRVAPKYAKIEDCEADFGGDECEESQYRTRSGSSIFMPVMAGYMIGRAIGGGATVAPQPLYRSADDRGNFRTADNRRVGGTTGFTRVASRAARSPSVKTSTVGRGGFGANARASASG